MKVEVKSYNLEISKELALALFNCLQNDAIQGHPYCEDDQKQMLLELGELLADELGMTSQVIDKNAPGVLMYVLPPISKSSS